MEKHEFILKLSGYYGTIIIENNDYMNSHFHCKICDKSVGEMFETKGLSHTNFGTSFEQEAWLNANIPCLTVEERIIKNLLE